MPGMIVYSGPSKYDGAPIVVILIKPEGKANVKTGAVIQQYIIRADVDPLQASRMGLDYSVCGNCKHRGQEATYKATGEAIDRTCYVTLHHAPLGVYKAFKRGSYPEARTIDHVQAFIDGALIRLGAYGDPASLPSGLNDLLISLAGGHTSYTHGHTVGETLGDNAARYSMVSADSIDDAIKAHRNGYRTFRVIPIAQANEPLLQNEIMCPSDRGIKCIDCGLCNGTKYKNGKSIAIVAHGKSKNKVK